ncbi:MAG: hypothetical protein FDZ70_05035 [Actinobacteria bacterium]|nr:MAG: hypothetical protein FDZ70_05035 [Actinomycetota bacterium]
MTVPGGPAPKAPPEAAGVAMIVAAALTWGAIPLFVRNVHTSAVVIVFWRMAFALAATLPFTLAAGGQREFAALPARRKVGLAVQGALLGLNWVLFFTGLQLAPVAVAEMLAYCGPVLVAALAPVWLGERFDRRILVPLALALGGTALILGPTDLSGGARTWLGAACAGASAFTYAALVLNAKRLVTGMSTMLYMTVEWVVALALLSPALLLPGPTAPIEWGSLAVLGVVQTAATGFLFVTGLRGVRADRAATLTYLEPAGAVLFAAAFLGEGLTAVSVAGGLAVIAAGAIVARLAPAPASGEAP